MPSRRDLANAIRALSMDAVQKANSGHPGAPMGMADIAEVLWNDFMHHNPANPKWPNRDRFVLSNGHGSMLVYSLLHLTGYDLSMEDIKQFRQLHSKTPGHPEYGYTPGVETTTGPLGQGVTNAVGMAIAEKMLAGQFNREGHKIVDHYTYVFLGDGCMMEGISHESCSLAGTLGLGKLIAFWDDNGISIDGHVEGWFTDDTAKRFEAYGWHVVRDVDGHDAEAVKKAIQEARSVNDKPSMICCKTVIGWGAPNLCGSHDCHGAALGEEEVAATRENLGWKYPPFVVPDEIYAGWNARDKGASNEAAWAEKFAAYKAAHPALAAEFERRAIKNELPADWAAKAKDFIAGVNAKAEKIATRKASQNAIGGFAPVLPELVGGSADLAGSNLTLWKDAKGISSTVSDGNYIYYGVREFAMSAIMNGIALHGGFIPYGGTFLVFSDYARNAVRMSALMKQRVIYVYTHDSIGLGEDGPTHQPIEHVSSLRVIPNMQVWRPCDAVESAVAWQAAVERQDGPSCLVFSRQGLAHMPRDDEQIAAIRSGGYTLVDCQGQPQAIVIATGSEVEIAAAAAKTLAEDGVKVRVVSMPCTNVFDAQDAGYKESVLPRSVTARVAIEAGVSEYWARFVGDQGKVIGINRFGESAPAGLLYKEFGFTAENVVKAVREQL
ncbi:MAG: transketolase [Gammaproteobacteria bacterium]|jgi:transketolase